MKKLHVELVDEKPKSKDGDKKDGKYTGKRMTEMIKFVVEHGVGGDGKKITTEEATALVESLGEEEKKEIDEERMMVGNLETWEVRCTECYAKNMRHRTYCWYCDADMELQRNEREVDEFSEYEEDKALFRTYEDDDKDEKLRQMKDDEEAWRKWEKKQRGEEVEENNMWREEDKKWREYWQKRMDIEEAGSKAIVVDGKSLIGREEEDDETSEWMHGVLDLDGKWKTWGELLEDNMREDTDDEEYIWRWYKKRILDMDGVWKTMELLKRDYGFKGKRKGKLKRKHKGFHIKQRW